ncbi:MAG TPA: 50S ribosomal protein L4 [Candidatus Paceibacterota bacterium]|nr:50S ribosomal protein L4 [Candidatus Paceibacterota bacterium]
MEAKIYNQKGKESGNITLPENVFGLPWNADLVHQVVTSIQNNQRNAWAHTKDRGDVSGGGKKPWQQKGTGRARHGSTRSPIWVGGGVAHGPRNDKNYKKKINKKMKAKALYTVISKKLKDGEVIFLENLNFATPKTRDAKGLLTSLKVNRSAYIAIPGKDENVKKSFNNFSNLMVEEVRNLNALDILNHKFLVITNPTESVKFIEGKMAAKKKE